MKKLVAAAILLMMAIVPRMAGAQSESGKCFDHLSVALNVSTLGPGLEFAAPLGSHFALRAGFTTLPFNFTYDYDKKGLEVEADAKVKLMNGNMLADWFPFQKVPFHLTAGLYMGNTGIDATGHSNKAFEIGGTVIEPDEQGMIVAKLKTNTVKPYFGLGFGRSIPRSHFGFKMEVGAMYHGTPKIETSGTGYVGDVTGDEVNKITESLTKWKFYPMLSFQLVYRIF